MGATLRGDHAGLQGVGRFEVRGGLRVETAFIKNGRQTVAQESQRPVGQGFVVEQTLDRMDLGVGEPASQGDGQSPCASASLGLTASAIAPIRTTARSPRAPLESATAQPRPWPSSARRKSASRKQASASLCRLSRKRVRPCLK